MTAPAYTQLIALPVSGDEVETPVARRIREIRQTALNLLSQALSSPVISEGQRMMARAKAMECHDIHQLLSWYHALVAYVAGVSSGTRLPQPEPAASAEVVTEEVTAQAVHQPGQQQPEAPARMVATRRVLRKARRMSFQQRMRLRAALQARRNSTEPLTEPVTVPMWAEAAKLSALPGGLYWSGQEDVPAVGESLLIVRPGSLSGKATVKGYFHAEGFLGVIADFEKVPPRYQKAPRCQYVFGRQLQRAAA